MRQVLGCTLFRHPVHGARSAQSTAQRIASPSGGPPQSEASRALNTAPSPRAGCASSSGTFLRAVCLHQGCDAQ